ncbi:hypothetical protein PFISCL1PPCAC_14584, partial [Pristionchus fissidentatus]
MKCFGSKTDDALIQNEKSEGKRFTWAEWKKPIIVIILSFLFNVEATMLGMGEWPYMSAIDHETTSSFFGLSTALSKAGHAIFAFVFAIWAHKISGIR